jgi:hypothetical protein
MLKKNILPFLLICIATCFVSACATPTYKFFEGKNPLPGQVAILSSMFMDKNVRIYMIDGKRDPDPVLNKVYFGSKWDGSFRIELLPGKHTLSIGHNENVLYLANYKEISFVAEAGKEYTVKAQEINIDKTYDNIINNRNWKAWVEKINEISK